MIEATRSPGRTVVTPGPTASTVPAASVPGVKGTGSLYRPVHSRVLGGTAAGGAHALGGFDPSPGRAYRVVALVAGDGEAAGRAGADRIVALPFDPGGFTADMIDLVS